MQDHDKLINDRVTLKESRSVEVDALFDALRADFNKTKDTEDGFETLLIGENNKEGIDKFLAWIPYAYEVFTQKGELKMDRLTVPVYGIKAQLRKKVKEELAKEQLEIVKNWFFDTKRREPWRTNFELNCVDFSQEMIRMIVKWFCDDMHFISFHDEKQNLVIIKQNPTSNIAVMLGQLNKGYDDLVYLKEKGEIMERAIQNAKLGLGHVDLFHANKNVLEYLIEWLGYRGTCVFDKIEETNYGFKSKMIWDRHLYNQSVSKVVKI